jgi:hypothetical protein
LKRPAQYTALVAVVLLSLVLLSPPARAAEIDAQAATGSVSYSAVGSGTTVGAETLLLAHINLTANERAAKFHGTVVSSTGVQNEVYGVGYMIPEIGWVITSSGSTSAQLQVNPLNPLIVDLSATGGTGTVQWIGYLDIAFTQNYAP